MSLRTFVSRKKGEILSAVILGCHTHQLVIFSRFLFFFHFYSALFVLRVLKVFGQHVFALFANYINNHYAFDRAAIIILTAFRTHILGCSV